MKALILWSDQLLFTLYEGNNFIPDLALNERPKLTGCRIHQFEKTSANNERNISNVAIPSINTRIHCISITEMHDNIPLSVEGD